MPIEAHTVLHSISPDNIELYTVQCRYPKFIHGELMTHRVFSRNASSSRAIPTHKLIEEVRSHALRAQPIFWGKNQKGMEAVEELPDYPASARPYEDGYVSPKVEVQVAWTRAALNAAYEAERMLKWSAHKQIVNRILEPFSHINVLVSATEWDNFFGLRLDKGAQPEMRALAEAIWHAKKASTPTLLHPGEWHLPYVSAEEISQLMHDDGFVQWYQQAIKVSVARCARVSYLSNDTGKRSTMDEDLKLYERLMGSQPLHASPAEHQATPDTQWDSRSGQRFENYWDQWQRPHMHGNFKGWIQYRKTLANEGCAPLPESYRTPVASTILE